MVNFGDPEFGVSEAEQKPAKEEKPLTNKPDWDRYGHPDRQKPKIRRPTETGVDKPTPPPTPTPTKKKEAK